MDLKQKIIAELNSKAFPDLKFLYDNKSLDYSLIILEELLRNEITFFKKILKTENKFLTFETFESDGILDYYWKLLNHYENINSNEKTRNIIETFRPKLQDYSNKIAYSKKYYEKLIYLNEKVDLDQEQKRIIYLSIKAYKDRGINLGKDKQKQLKEINKKLGKISNKFSNNIIDDEKDFEYIICDYELIKDLPKEVLEIAEEASGKKGTYKFDSDPTSRNAIMKYCNDRKIRKDFEKFSYTIASSGKFDNRKNVLKILELKRKKAKILGYNNFAELSLHTKMAKEPEKVVKLLKEINLKAKKKAKKDINELKGYFKLKEISSYDFSYYSRILKEEKYKLDEKELKKYFEFEQVINYLFSFVEEFYGIKIKEKKINSYDKEIRIYEIYKGKELISYYFLDAFYRKGKRHGAWANNLRTKTYLGEKKVSIVMNVCNFQKAIKGKTTLYLRDVETLFHEFGHALHEILSESKYSDLTGFGVEWDFVEVPSQLLENWAKEEESIKKFAKNVISGELIPEEMILKLKKLKNFMAGIFWMRQNEFALLDMNLYMKKTPKNIRDLDTYILKLVNKYSFFKRNKDYKMYCSFSHIFDGGYSAGYYSYMRAEIIEADLFEKIKEKGMFSKKTGEELKKTIMGQGTRKDAKDLFYDYMGRDVDKQAFLNRYSLK